MGSNADHERYNDDDELRRERLGRERRSRRKNSRIKRTLEVDD